MRRKDRPVITADGPHSARAVPPQHGAAPAARRWWGRPEARFSGAGDGARRSRGAWGADERPAFDEDLAMTDVLVADAVDSAALVRWKDRLGAYAEQQGPLDALRLRPRSEPPWPAADNPMLGYLSERAGEIALDEGVASALAWLASSAWFEGAIAERSRFARILDTD